MSCHRECKNAYIYRDGEVLTERDLEENIRYNSFFVNKYSL